MSKTANVSFSKSKGNKHFTYFIFQFFQVRDYTVTKTAIHLIGYQILGTHAT